MLPLEGTNSLVDILRELVEGKGLTRRKRPLWGRKWILRRFQPGVGGDLIVEEQEEEPKNYVDFMKMSDEMFTFLCHKVATAIQSDDTEMGATITTETKLRIAFRFLATGDSLASLQHLYRVPKCTISTFLPHVLNTVYAALEDIIKVSSNRYDWRRMKNGFWNRWNFLHCFGGTDGKHVLMQGPPNSRSQQFSYEDCSLKLFGGHGHLVDNQDASVYRFGQSRRMVKNTFSILSCSFRVFSPGIQLNPGSVSQPVESACVLHNWKKKSGKKVGTPISQDVEDTEAGLISGGIWRDDPVPVALRSLETSNQHNHRTTAAVKREFFIDYFIHEGTLPRQCRMIT